jgi:hypothetical protein
MTARPMDYGVGASRSGMVATMVEASFNYNKPIPVEDSQIRSLDKRVEPLGGVSNQSGTWIITLEPSRNEYVSLKDCVLETKMKVVKADNSALDPLSSSVAHQNMMAQCMWENIDVRLNGTPMSGASAVNIGYKAYMESMLSYDNDASMTHLVAQGFHPDSAGEMETHRLPLSHIKRTFFDMVAREKLTPELPENVTNKWYGQNSGQKDAEGNVLTDDQIMELNLKNAREYNAALETYFNTWMKDDVDREVNRMNSLYGAHDKFNKGFVARAGICGGSEEFTVVGPIPHNFFSINNHLSPLNKLEIRLTRYPDRFLLNTEQYEKGYKIVLTDMRLHVKSVIRRENIPIPMKEVYEMSETQLFKQVVPADLLTFNFRMVNTGILPKTIIMGMVSTAACEGTYNLNPFNFHHFNISRLSLLINGEEHPQGGLEFKWMKRNNPDVMRAYHWLFANSGALARERGNLINYNSFISGYFILPFDLTHDRCNQAHQHNAEFGYIDVQMVFEDALKRSITILYELVYNKQL